MLEAWKKVCEDRIQVIIHLISTRVFLALCQVVIVVDVDLCDARFIRIVDRQLLESVCLVCNPIFFKSTTHVKQSAVALPRVPVP